MDRIEQNDEYIFIYTSAAAAYFIPKRAFTGSQAEDFYTLAIRGKHEADAARS